MAEVYDERLGKPDDAMSSYREVLELDPASHVALAALDALFTRQPMWSELAENLEAQLAPPRTKTSKSGSCSASRRCASRR